MKKILYLLMITALFVSCSSDDDNTDPNNGNGNKGMIDEKILGKWKVEYSKTIKPAIYNETTSKPEYNEDASVREYDGNFGEPDIVPGSGMFDINEYKIEIKSNNTIISTRANNNPTITVSYQIEDGYLKWISTGNTPYTIFIKYKLDNNKLIMEMVKATGITLVEYRISEYSKITE